MDDRGSLQTAYPRMTSGQAQPGGGPDMLYNRAFFRQTAEGAGMKKTAAKPVASASERIDRRIAELDDWRGEMLTRLRRVIREAAPDLTEEWKWDSPVWADHGLVCAVGAFNEHIKVNFFKGASLKDPKRLFNAGLDAMATRAIDIREEDKVDEAGLKELVRAAVAYNRAL